MLKLYNNFKFHDAKQWLTMKQEIVFLGNLEGKLSLVMKFGQLMLYYKRKVFMKNLYKKIWPGN